MEKTSIIDSFNELKENKMMDKATIMYILEETIRKEIEKKFETSDNFDIIFNPDKGDIEIWQNKLVVKDSNIENENKEIGLSEVRKIEDDFELGEEYSIEFDLLNLGRRSIMNIKQMLINKIKNFDSEKTVKHFQNLIGYIYSAEVYHIKRNYVMLIDNDQNEIIIPKNKQIYNDFYRKGDIITGIIEDAFLKNTKPFIIMSRISNEFLSKLIEQEVPEILDGLVSVKNVVRKPGDKAKVVVETYDDKIDPVGTCIGVRGTRINPISRELNQEGIDVVQYSNNFELYLTRLFKPVKILNIDINDEKSSIDLKIKSSEMHKAIGKKGNNIQLIEELVNYDINIITENIDATENTEDVLLTEFDDEIDKWIINEFIKVGVDTAKTVLKYSTAELSDKTDLEEETVEEVLKIIKNEFE